MRIAVIGAGVVGVTSAYELASDGHEVTVFERRGTVGVESSFAHTGLISPVSIAPWVAPSVVSRLRRRLFMSRAPNRGPEATSPWTWQWLRTGNAQQQRINQLRMHRLSLYSRDLLHRLTTHLGLEYERAAGHLVLLRSSKESEALEPTLDLLRQQGLLWEECDATRCRAVEPGLNASAPLHSGLYFPNDEVSNCRQFALLLRGEAEKHGAIFRFHTTVQSIDARSGSRPSVISLHASHDGTALGAISHSRPRQPAFDVTQPLNGPERTTFDAILVCAAAGALPLLSALKMKLPLASVRGHSITMPMRHHEAHPDVGPRASVTDHAHQIVLGRLGTRVRVSGGADFGAPSQQAEPEALARLYKALEEWFPGAAQLSQAQRWSGSRPTLPDGPPVIGSSGIPGIWVNLGHGAAGWAMACGSARLIADKLAGRPPAIDAEGLGVERLGF